MALALLVGAYNPLRKHSENDEPIDLEKLNSFKDRFNELIWEVKNEMNLNIDGLEEF